uniref:Ras guanyl-releasing protein 3 n=1 Tax=Globodera rostochiensis TaxID=31243 RepID=A0A914HI62_GLORO
MTDSPGCSDFGAEPVDLFELVRRCCDCFEGDPAEPDSDFPSWFFSASEWLCPELAELMAIFVSLYQNDPLGFGQKVCSAVGFWIHHHPVHFDANVQLGRLLERLKKLAAADETISKTLVDELLDISAIPSYAWLRNVSVRNPISRHVSLCFEQWSPEDIATSMSEAGQFRLANSESLETELAQTELTLTELAQTELTLTELAQTELTLTELAQTELTLTELAQTELTLTELAQTELTLAELAQTELAQTELAQTELTLTELAQTELAQTELAQTELTLTELTLAELAQTELAQTELTLTELTLAELAQTELAQTELTLTELAQTELAQTELAQTELAQTELAQTELAQTELAQTELAQTELAQTELTLTELAQTELTLTELAQTELTLTELAQTELTLTELAQTELAQTELAQTELTLTELAQTELAQTELTLTELAQTELAQTELAQTELAQTKDHIDHKVLSRVQVSELKRYVRVGRLCQTPLLERSIGIFNSFSGWVQCQVLSKSTPSERAEVITKFVQVGRHLRRNNTFNTLMAVIGGITHSNVARLLHTHSLLPPDIVDDLSALTKLLSHANNYAVYRKTLREVGSRFKIPIMGVHLKDLIAFWHSAGLDQFENSRRMSEKCICQLSQLLSHFLGVCRTPHCFGDANLDLINTLKVLFDIAYDERELYELSLEREPKTAPTAGATRGFSAEKSSQMATSAAEPPAVFADWAAGVCAQPDPDTVDKHIVAMVDAVFKHYDNDRDGYISRAEFEQFASNFPFLDAFGEIDADRDGFISRAEMCTHFQQLNRRKCPGAGEANGSSMLVAGLRRNGLMHKWLDAQFLAPALCAHCNKLLWMRHGVRCKMCACSLHEQCKAEAALKCTHRKRTPNSSASGSSSARSASESGGLMSSWLGASLSPRFTAIGPTPKKASAATADHQKELQMTNGHYRHAKRRGVSGDPRRHPRTSSASSASECSSHHSGGNAALLGAPEGSPPPTSPSGASYFFIGSSLRSSFHRLMRRTPAEAICERSEKRSGDLDNSDRTSRFDSTGDSSSSTSRTHRRRTTTVGGLECADADPPTPSSPVERHHARAPSLASEEVKWMIYEEAYVPSHLTKQLTHSFSCQSVELFIQCLDDPLI